MGRYPGRNHVCNLGDDLLRGLGVARGRISHFPIDLSRILYNTLADTETFHYCGDQQTVAFTYLNIKSVKCFSLLPVVLVLVCVVIFVLILVLIW